MSESETPLTDEQAAERSRIMAARAELRDAMAAHLHVPKPDGWEGAECAICEADLGWWCPKSPSNLCEYRASEFCRWCGDPSERK